jgi:hypothetical protein
MDNISNLIKELRPSQARRRGFESHHPLHRYKTIGSAAKVRGSRLLASGLCGFAATSCFPKLLLAQ